MDGEEEIKKAYESILNSDFRQAIDWFEQAIALEPDNAAYHYKLSITCARSNRLYRAIEHAEIAVRLDPDNETYRYHLRHLTARELVARAEKCFARNRDQLYMAAAYLKKAATLDPLNAEAYLLLAMAYAGLQEYADAAQALRELLRLYPQHESAKRLLDDYTEQWSRYVRDARTKRRKE